MCISQEWRRGVLFAYGYTRALECIVISIMKHIVSWEPEGRYCRSKIFHWEPEGRYRHTLCTAIAPCWFSTEHLWSAIMPFWLSNDYWQVPNIILVPAEYFPQLKKNKIKKPAISPEQEHRTTQTPISLKSLTRDAIVLAPIESMNPKWPQSMMMALTLRDPRTSSWNDKEEVGKTIGGELGLNFKNPLL